MMRLPGSMRQNNVLLDYIPPNGCHSDLNPHRFKTLVVRHGNGSPKNEAWRHVMSTHCVYNKDLVAAGTPDPRCAECKYR